MKKNLLLTAALMTAVSAFANGSLQTVLPIEAPTAAPALSGIPMLTPQPLQHRAPAQTTLEQVVPEGTPFTSYLSYSQNGAERLNYEIQVSIAPDGSAIYFSNLFPSFLTNEMGAWTKGIIQADGTINIPLQFIYCYADTYNLYAGKLDLSTLTMSDIQFVINADGSISQADPTEYCTLGALDDNGNLVTYAAFQNDTRITAQPISAGDPIVLPDGAETSTYIYNYFDAYKNRKLYKGQIAEVGNEVYFCGLTPDVEGSWIVGTKDGDNVTFQAGQYLGTAKGYNLQLGIIKAVADFSSYEMVDEATLTYDPATQTYVQVRESEDDPYYMFAEVTKSGQVYLYNFDYQVSPYAGLQPTVPADPYNVTLYNFFEQDSRCCIYFDNTNLGVNGEYLEPDHLFYQVYMDDELYVLPADNHASLSEDLTLIPWYMTDGIDFFFNATNHFVYVYDCLFESMGAQIVYVVDDVTCYSNIVTVDWDGNVTVTEVHNDTPTGIQQTAQAAAPQYFDLAGRRLAQPRPGFVLMKGNGSVKAYITK